MKLFDEFAYIVFPAYGGAFQDMEPRNAEWDQVFEGNYHFLYGFHGGGILSVPLSIPEQWHGTLTYTFQAMPPSHKDFIVVTYHKNAPVGKLEDSLLQLKKYFQNAGYKRILLTHGASSGVIIHEEFRPETTKKAE